MENSNRPKPNAAKMPAKAAKKQGATLKKSTSSSAKGLEKTRAASNRATLDSLMAGFQSGQGKAKTAMGIDLDSIIRLFNSAHAALAM